MYPFVVTFSPSFHVDCHRQQYIPVLKSSMKVGNSIDRYMVERIYKKYNIYDI